MGRPGHWSAVRANRAWLLRCSVRRMRTRRSVSAAPFFAKAVVTERYAGTPFITASDEIACPPCRAKWRRLTPQGLQLRPDTATLNTRHFAPTVPHDPSSNPMFASRVHLDPSALAAGWPGKFGRTAHDRSAQNGGLGARSSSIASSSGLRAHSQVAGRHGDTASPSHTHHDVSFTSSAPGWPSPALDG